MRELDTIATKKLAREKLEEAGFEFQDKFIPEHNYDRILLTHSNAEWFSIAVRVGYSREKGDHIQSIFGSLRGPNMNIESLSEAAIAYTAAVGMKKKIDEILESCNVYK